MPEFTLRRRPESVTADEVIENLKAQPRYGESTTHQHAVAVDQIEHAIRRICKLPPEADIYAERRK